MKKLEESLHFLQRHEEKLWFWGVDRAEDLGFSAEFLKEASLHLDRRNEFPAKPPTSPSSLNAMSRPSSWPIRRVLPKPFELPASSRRRLTPHFITPPVWSHRLILMIS